MIKVAGCCASTTKAASSTASLVVIGDEILSGRTKELLGLVASAVLRCDDCVRYHLIQCKACGLSTAELMECFAVANMVGGSIVIPHTRRALEVWEQLHL